MTLKTKIIIGVLIGVAAGAAYYFLVYKPGKDKEAKAADQKASESIASGPRSAVNPVLQQAPNSEQQVAMA